jgi:Tol biopolymer transport system component
LMAIPDVPKYTTLFLGQFNFPLSQVVPSFNSEFVSFKSYSQVANFTNPKGERWLYIQRKSTGNIWYIDNFTYDVEWSPFENKLADISTLTKGNFIYPEKINLINAETKARKTLLMIDYERYNVISLCWNPDGKRLAYLSNENYAANNYYNIWTIDTASLEKVRISDFEAKGFHTQGPISWPVNGSDVYLSGYFAKTKNKEQIYKYNVADNKLMPIIESDWNDKYPAVSPNKEYMAFISDRSGTSELWLLNLATNVLQQITGKLPAYSFDSRYTDIIWLNKSEIVLTLYQNATSVPVVISVGDGLK